MTTLNLIDEIPLTMFDAHKHRFPAQVFARLVFAECDDETGERVVRIYRRQELQEAA